jgi:hypothetical protein
MADERKTVWVLGAGFSRPLGGPLLTSMLSRTTGQDLAVRYPEERTLSDAASLLVRRLYHYGRRYHEGGLHPLDRFGEGGEMMWGDAEEFLEYLDTAAASDPNHSRERLARILRRLTDRDESRLVTVDDLRTAARRQMAAECCAFLQEVDITFEKWRPYVDWETQLGINDTIVTFNYDRVVEKLGGPVTVVLQESNLAAVENAKAATLLKMHGSVDWRFDNDGKTLVQDTSDAEVALHCDATSLAIATPGPTKSGLVDQSFRFIWGTASEAIRKASAIVFIGFRFPPSDAAARRVVLEAIAENREKAVALHVVLGPPSPDSQRLSALLHFACQKGGRGLRPAWNQLAPPSKGHYLVYEHALYAQDFLSVWSREQLFL